jgi:hypothetical protein
MPLVLKNKYKLGTCSACFAYYTQHSRRTFSVGQFRQKSRQLLHWPKLRVLACIVIPIYTSHAQNLVASNTTSAGAWLSETRCGICMDSDKTQLQQFFGIDIYPIRQFANIPTLRSNICVSDGPKIDVVINGQHWNLLNVTSSPNNCREFYKQTVCENVKPIPQLQYPCAQATEMILAVLQQVVECKNDLDCTYPRHEYTIPKFSCEWLAKLEQELCMPDAHNQIVCEKNDRKSTRIRNACVFTDPFCHYIVTNRSFLSPLLGIFMFSISFTLIYCTAPHQLIHS